MGVKIHFYDSFTETQEFCQVESYKYIFVEQPYSLATFAQRSIKELALNQ